MYVCVVCVRVPYWQAHCLDAETLAKREVVKIDIANDQIRSGVSCIYFYYQFMLAEMN